MLYDHMEQRYLFAKISISYLKRYHWWKSKVSHYALRDSTGCPTIIARSAIIDNPCIFRCRSISTSGLITHSLKSLLTSPNPILGPSRDAWNTVTIAIVKLRRFIFLWMSGLPTLCQDIRMNRTWNTVTAIVKPLRRFICLWMSGLPTLCHDIRRNRKTIVYSKSYAKKVLLICKSNLFCNFCYNFNYSKNKFAIP